MPHRIIYCALSCASLLTQAPHDALRPLDQGVVAAVSDDVMGTLLEKDPNLPILYFSRTGYDRAMRGLNDGEVDEALRKRLKQWSPDPLKDSIAWLTDDELRVLSLVARATPTSSGEKAKILAAHFNEGLDLLSQMTGSRRLDRSTLAESVSEIEEQDAYLIAELSDTNRKIELQTRGEFAGALGREMARRGRPQFVDSLPYVELKRGVWISPPDNEVEAYVKVREMNWVSWRDGVVLWLSTRAIEEFRKRGKTVEILYFDADAVEEDVGPLTKAQLDLRLAEALKADEATQARLKDDYLNRLRLNVALERRFLRKRVATEDKEMSPLLEQQVSEETDILARELARSRRWLLPGDRTSELRQIIAAEEELMADAAFFKAVARRRGNDDFLLGEFEEVLQAKQRDLRRLAEMKD
jgi:hypothetical protein